jgi:very-short-patch-repair endonuclease
LGIVGILARLAVRFFAPVRKFGQPVAVRPILPQPLPERLPFQPRGNRPPSAALRAIALQRRQERFAKPTAAEVRFNEILRGIGFVEGRHYEREYVWFYPGSFCILDVYFPTLRLAVELDGTSHDVPGQREHDSGRDAYLAAQGVRTCRIANRVVMGNRALCESIVLSELGCLVSRNVLVFSRSPILAIHGAQGRSGCRAYARESNVSAGN